MRCAPMRSTCIRGAWCLPFAAQHPSWLQFKGHNFLRLRCLFTLAMSDYLPTVTTTYTFTSLPPRHIRLLELTIEDTSQDNGRSGFKYRIVHVELPEDDPAPASKRSRTPGVTTRKCRPYRYRTKLDISRLQQILRKLSHT